MRKSDFTVSRGVTCKADRKRILFELFMEMRLILKRSPSALARL